MSAAAGGGATGPRAGARAAIGAALLAAALLPLRAEAQIEVRSAERAEELARIELEEVPLRRHLVSSQKLALWLPEGWGEGVESDRGPVKFTSADGRRLLVLRSESEPGAGLIQIMDGVLEGLQSTGLLRRVDSLRRLRIAGREAFEIAGSGVRDDGGDAARAVVSLDPDRAYFRMLLIQGEEGPAEESPAEPLDAEYKRLIRDWTPLEASVWTTSLELARRELIDDAEASTAWDERNRLFDVIARPEAIGLAWIGERLESLAAEDPRLLLDGLLHHHPRVRIGCLEAIDPAALAEPARSELYAAAMLDADPAVRFRVASRIAGDLGIALDIFFRTLEVDSERARAAAFQLLAAAPDRLRAQLSIGAFSGRRHYPESSQPLLAALLAEWGPPSEAESLLREAWQQSRLESLGRAAWLALLELGDAEALAAARQRLERPLEPSSLPLRAAATWSAVHADAAGDVEPWRTLAAALPEAPESDGGEDEEETEADLEAARATLEELISHLEALASAGSDECGALADLLGAGAWAAARHHRLGCPTEPPAGLVRAAVPRPGAYAFALLDLIGRLEVGSAVQNQAFHSLVETLDRRIDQWAGDPVTTGATGVDLEAPWELRWWAGAGANLGGGRGLSGGGGASLRLSSSDPERFLDTLLRVTSGPVDLENLAQGVFASHAMALMPVALAGVWSSEQETFTGTDDSRSTPVPTETYVALGTAEPAGDSEHRVLYRLEVGEEGPDWRLTHLFRSGDEVMLTHAAEPAPAPGDRRDPAPGQAASASRIEVDLAGVFERLAAEDEEVAEEILEMVSRGASFSAATALDAEAIATSFRLDGLPPEWLAVGVDAAPRDLRAPAELLPEGCLGWVGVNLSPPYLAERLGDASEELFEGLGRRARRRIVELVEHLDGEAGVALLGVPDPRTEEPGKAWGDRVVVYVSADPAKGDRFLRKVIGGRRKHDGRRVYTDDELSATRIGRFLVFAADPEAFSALARPPYLASSPIYGRIAERAPAGAMLWAAWDTDRLADALGESIRARDGGEESTFPVEVFRSLGGVVGWLGRSDEALVGELATSPRLQSEAARARTRRLAAYGDLAWGSVSARGLPGEATAGLAQSLLEVTLRLPEEVPDIDLAWANQRLDQELLEPGLYRLVSRAGEALPEESALTLPITAPELLPYARDEHNLDLHSGEIRELAASIRGEETDPARIVRAIVDWAHESLEYTVIDERVSAERILATRQADCTEFTQLTIAVARALGIPARGVHGIVVGSEAAYFHRWAEVYLDRWYEVDPTWGVVRVPATNLRVPVDDGRFIASLPGARFTVQAVDGDDGAWARRLPGAAAAPPAGERAAEIAVDGDRVLLALPSGSAGQAAAPARRVLYSADGGRSFDEIPPPGTGGGPPRLLGGHGRLLWLQRAEGPAGRLAAYELDAARRWRRLRLPEALGGGVDEEWTFGLHPDGYLALAGGAPEVVVLDRDLASARTAALPADGAGEWVLAREPGLLARAAEGEGISLHQWDGEGWAVPVEIADSADLAAVEVRRSGERVQVIGRHRESGQLMRLVVGPDSSQTRRSASPEEAAAFAATTGTTDGEWTVWIDDRHEVLVRRPLDATVPDV